MKRITESERIILDRLVFLEHFDTLLQETKLHTGVLKADILNLLHKGLIDVCDETGKSIKASRGKYYDADAIQQFAFRATKSGLDVLKQYPL